MKNIKTIFLSRVHLSGNKKKVAKNVFWAMLGKIVNMGGALLVGILIARYLEPEQYGLMNYVISYVSLFMILSDFGLPNIEIRELSVHKDDKDRILGTCLGLRILFAIITYLLIILTLILFKTDSSTTILILVYALSIFANVFTLIRNYFTSIVLNEYIVKTEIVRTIIGAFIKVLLVLLNCPLEYFVIALFFDTILVSSGYILSYKRIVGSMKVWFFDKTYVSFLLKESFPLVLSGAAVVIYQRIDQVMIGNMIDKTSVGYFATAEKFLSLILFLPTVLTQTVVPFIVEAKAEGNQKKYELMKRQMISIVVWTSIFMAFIVSVSSYWLISLTFGEKYLMAIPVLQILAWKTVGMALSTSSGQIIIIEHLQKWAFIRNAIACAVCVGLNYLLIPIYGISGSAWVTIATVFVAAYLANAFIPPYHKVMKLQTYALFFGWKDLRYLKSFRR